MALLAPASMGFGYIYIRAGNPSKIGRLYKKTQNLRKSCSRQNQVQAVYIRYMILRPSSRKVASICLYIICYAGIWEAVNLSI